MYNATEEAMWIDHGDNAWQLTAASLVGMQSVPGLVVLYAGIMRSKWAINSAFMAFYGFAATLIVWVLWAYKVGFGQYMLPFAGRPGPIMAIDMELQQSTLPSADVSQNFPLATMVYFQFVFAAITIVIIAGAFLGRMNFTAWMLFVPLWITFSYSIGAYSIWAGGFLYQRGVIDYSGGYVIHLSSGTAGFVGAHWIGPRLPSDRADARPSNVLCVLIGAGLLWIGWNGFNGGDPYAASADAGVAVLNTNITTAMSLLCWTICDMIYFKKPSVLGAVQGMITGLVAITPAAGVVAGWGAVVIGVCSGTIPWVSMNIVGKKVAYLRKIDDVLGIFHTHCVTGALGGFLTGIFATVDGSAAFGLANPGGAIDGNGKQVYIQIYSALFVIAWNTFWTSMIMLFIKYVCRIPLRMTVEQLEIGDDAVHGEAAYVLGPFESHDTLVAGHYLRHTPTGPGELSMGGVRFDHHAKKGGVTLGEDPNASGSSGKGDAINPNNGKELKES